MPIANHPNQLCPLSLAIDADLPEAERPVFLCRFLTLLEIETLPAKLDAITEITDYFESHRQLSQFLAIGVRGWRNIRDVDGNPLEFSPENFNKVLTGHEKFELAHLMIHGPRLSESDRKKSFSPSPSAKGSSAPAAREESVTMSPPEIAPSISTPIAPAALAGDASSATAPDGRPSHPAL